MDAFRIEILNPKALQLIKDMQDLKLIKVSDEPAPALKSYLKKMRSRAAMAPDENEVLNIVEDVRAKRLTKK